VSSGQGGENQLINGNYVSIPEKTMRSKAWRAMPPSTRVVYQTMLLRYRRTGKGANGQVTWLQTELAEEAGISVRTVKRSLTELRAYGWIEVVEVGCKWTRGTTYQVSSRYANGRT